MISYMNVNTYQREENNTQYQYLSQPIAIIGIACLFPKAQNLREYWANIKNKVDAITDIPPTHWDPKDYYHPDPKMPDHTYCKRGGFIPSVDFDPSEYGITPQALEAIDSSQLLGLVVASAALEDAGYGSNRNFDRSKVAVILGLTGTLELVIPLGARLGHPIWRKALKKAGVPDDIAQEVIQNISNSYVAWQENSFPGLLGNVAAGRISNRLNLQGTNCIVDAACGSSLAAVHMAILELETNRANMAVTGGIDTFNDIFMYMCFSKTPALSPTQDARPFSIDSDGTILGEGIGMVVLKRLSDAIKDNDKIYCIIKGIGTSSDGKGKAIYAPSAEGQMLAIKRAQQQSNVTPETIELIEAHGTGTKVGDEVEISALKQIFSSPPLPNHSIAIGSVKSQIGHTKAAAGTAGLIKIALALYNKTIPPTIKISKPNPLLTTNSAFYLPKDIRPWFKTQYNKAFPRRAAVSSFGFGGSNYHAILEEFNNSKLTTDWTNEVEIISFSSNNYSDLIRQIIEFRQIINNEPLEILAAKSRINFSTECKYKLAFAYSTKANNINSILDNIISLLNNNCDKFISQTPAENSSILPTEVTPNVWFNNHNNQIKSAIIFPGQGSQYCNMGLHFVCTFPEAFNTLQIAEDILPNLTNLIYPIPLYDELHSKNCEIQLTQTQWAQPAIGAISIAYYNVLKKFGYEPNVVAGHSYGELPALCAANVFSFEDLIKLSHIRGNLMNLAFSNNNNIQTGMLAIAANIQQVVSILQNENIPLEIANENSPNQIVVSGELSLVKSLHEILSKKYKIKSTILNVAGAFHSKYMISTVEGFINALKEIKLSQPAIPIFSNTTALQYPPNTRDIINLLANQLAKPVKFTTMIENIYNFGVKIFVEVAPSAKISNLILSILKNNPHKVLTLDSNISKKEPLLELANALAYLSVANYKINLKLWEESENKISKYKPQNKKITFKICGANYRSSNSPSSQAQNQVINPKFVNNSLYLSVRNDRTMEKKQSSPNSINNNFYNNNSTNSLNPSKDNTSSQNPILANNTITQPNNSAFQNTNSTCSYQSQSMPTNIVLPQYSSINKSSHASLNILELETIKLCKETIASLQQLQLYTTNAHKQFLETQEKTALAIQSIIDRIYNNSNTHLTSPYMLPSQLANSSSLANTVTSPTNQICTSPQILHPQNLNTSPSAISPSNYQSTNLNNVYPSKDENENINSIHSQANSNYPNAQSNVQQNFPSQYSNFQQTAINPSLSNQFLHNKHNQFQETFNNITNLQSSLTSQNTQVSMVNPTLSQNTSYNFPMQNQENYKSLANNTTPNLDYTNFTNSLLQIISNKTGYPTEMLNPSMDMEADLGIDSIKRVEIMSAIQEKFPNLPTVPPEQIGKFKSIQNIIDYLFSPPNQSNLSQKLNNHETNQTKSSSIESNNLPQSQISDYPLSDSNVSSSNIQSNIDSQITSSDIIDSTTLLNSILSVVSEKTGYPIEMLKLDMDMEADLGIDSIKRVEIMSAIQEKFPYLPTVPPEELGKFKTLRNIIDFLTQNSSNNTSTKPTNNTITSQTTEVCKKKISNKQIKQSIDNITNVSSIQLLNSNKNEVSLETINNSCRSNKRDEFNDLYNSKDSDYVNLENTTNTNEKNQTFICEQYQNLVSNLNITYLRAIPYEESAKPIPIYLPAGSTIAITDDKSDLVRELVSKFTQRGYNVSLIDLFDKNSWNLKANTHALIIVYPYTYSRTDSTILWSQKNEEIVFLAFKLFQNSSQILKNSAISAPVIFATISRIDGKFGLDISNLHPSPTTSFDPCQGGLAGLAKTVQKEMHELTVKAFDIDNSIDPQIQAEKLVTYLFRTTPLEVGIHANGVYILEEKIHTLSDKLKIYNNSLSSNDVIIITGGGRGITSEISKALAKAYKPTLVLIGRTPPPSQEPIWLKNLKTEYEIKQAIVKNYPNGINLKPKELESIYKSIIANREITNTLQEINYLGSKVIYKQLDIRNAKAVYEALSDIKTNIGDIIGVIHGAGVLRDRRIEDKTDEQFLEVFETKVTGLRNILSSINLEKLKFLVLFSSSTARYGRLGQVDYAIANEILNKVAQKFALFNPQTAVISFNWGPWEGGMVNESLKKIFTTEGIGLIGFESGAMLFLDILSQALKQPKNYPKEIIVIGSFQQKTNSNSNKSLQTNNCNMLLHPTIKTKSNVVLEKEISINNDKFILSHIIDSKPVLPAAFMIEYLAYAAISYNPGLTFYSLENFKVLKGIILEPPTYTTKILISASKAIPIDIQKYKAYVEIRNAVSEIIHSTAEVILIESYNSLPKMQDVSYFNYSLTEFSRYPYTTQEVYKNLLFHGKDFQMIKEILGWTDNKILIKINSAKAPNYYSTEPINSFWITNPITIDGAFQAVILWTLARLDSPSLPSSIEKYVQYSSIPLNDLITIYAEISKFSTYNTKANILFVNTSNEILAKIENYECTLNKNLKEKFKQNFIQFYTNE